MPKPYRYSLYGRRPMTLIGLAASIGFSALLWRYGAPWFVLAPVLVVIPMMLAAVVWNPVYGMRIDRQALEIDLNGKVKRFPLASIDYVKITQWTDSSDATIHLVDGSIHQIPHMARPSIDRFCAVLADHAIAVTKD
jgi:hypothetical protein